MIFAVQPESVGESRSDASRVYGVIMDFGMLNTRSSTAFAFSLSAFSSGEVSFHATPGKAVIMSGDPKIDQVAQEIVQIAQGLLHETNPTQEFSLPEPGFVQFFFLTIFGACLVFGMLAEQSGIRH